MPTPPKPDRLGAARASRSRAYEERLATILRRRGWHVERRERRSRTWDGTLEDWPSVVNECFRLAEEIENAHPGDAAPEPAAEDPATDPRRAEKTAAHLASPERQRLTVGRMSALYDLAPRPGRRIGDVCPDGGRCGHACVLYCWRVACCEPLSGVFPADRWPESELAEALTIRATFPDKR